MPEKKTKEEMQASLLEKMDALSTYEDKVEFLYKQARFNRRVGKVVFSNLLKHLNGE
jgi:hypothetical protein